MAKSDSSREDIIHQLVLIANEMNRQKIGRLKAGPTAMKDGDGMSTTMTAAAVLRRIKKLRGEIGILDERLKKASVYVEGKEPAFGFKDTWEARQVKLGELLKMQTALSISNAKTFFTCAGKSVNVAWAVRRTQEIKAEVSLLVMLPIREQKRDVEVRRDMIWNDAAEKSVPEVTQTVYLSALSKVEQSKLIEDLTAGFEELNTALEACNHATLIDFE